MDVPGIRTWIIFFLISFVVLLWALFLSVSGAMLWVSLMLVIIVTGINFGILIGEVRAHTARQELMKELSTEVVEKRDRLPPGG